MNRKTGSAATPTPLVAAAIEAARAGDRDALRFLYIRFSGEMRGALSAVLPDEPAASDVIQEVFAQLGLLWSEPGRSSVPLASLLRSLTRAAAVKRLSAAPDETAQVPDVTVDGSVDHQFVSGQTAFRGLPADEREVLLLRHVMGLSPAEIARRLRTPEAVVHGLHHRARTSLRASVAQLDAAAREPAQT